MHDTTTNDEQRAEKHRTHGRGRAGRTELADPCWACFELLEVAAADFKLANARFLIVYVYLVCTSARKYERADGAPKISKIQQYETLFLQPGTS